MDKLYVGITNTDWLNFIKRTYNNNTLNDYINFWIPGKRTFRAINHGDIFLFKLHNNKQKSEHGEIIGGAYFCSCEKMSSSAAWNRFGNGNGTATLEDLDATINGYRTKNNILPDTNINCIILERPFFFEEPIDSPNDWRNGIVSGKTYDTSFGIGKDLKELAISKSIDLDKTFNESLTNDLNTLALEGKDKYAFIKTRINQSVFRNRLLSKYNTCCLCQIENPSLLRASHIKPWSECLSHEKLDVNNGFLLCPNHDTLFDNGYISFLSNGEILISSELSSNDCIFTNVHSKMKIGLTEENKKYLLYHRNNIFRK